MMETNQELKELSRLKDFIFDPSDTMADIMIENSLDINQINLESLTDLEATALFLLIGSYMRRGPIKDFRDKLYNTKIAKLEFDKRPAMIIEALKLINNEKENTKLER